MYPQALETDALVLDTVEYGESDLILTLYTSDFGRLSALARGARKSQKRFVNKLELFSLLQVNLHKRTAQGLFFLESAELLDGLLPLRRHPGLYTAASVVREVLLLATREGERDDRLFLLASWALRELQGNSCPPAILAIFLLRLFSYAGYQPNLSSCQRCHNGYLPERSYSFVVAENGIVCSNCRPNEGGRQPALSLGTLRSLTMLQQQPEERLGRCRLVGEVLDESLELVHDYGRHLYQREIHSWKLFRRFYPPTVAQHKR